MHGQVQASFNLFEAGIKSLSLATAYRYDKAKTNIGLVVHFLDYGNIAETDAAGNQLGEFRPVDYFIQLTASREYEEKWQYGASIKFIQSRYGSYSSSAIAIDASGSYYDSATLFQASLLLKNMGSQLKRFSQVEQEELPFDIQFGISKRLSKAPVQFSFTAHHLHRFDLLYKDSLNHELEFNNTGFIDKLFRHFVFATQVYIENKIELSLGYNHLTRRELSIPNSSSGLTGFSMGIGLISRKFDLRFARTSYQNNTAFNHLGIGVSLF